MCAFARAHLLQCVRLCVRGGRLRTGRKGRRDRQPAKCVSMVRDGTEGEAPSRNRGSDVSCYTPPLEEEGKRKEGEAAEEEEEAGASVLQRR